MITDLVLAGVYAVMHAVFDALPAASLSGLLVSVNSACAAAGNAIASWNAYLPLSELCAILAVLVGTWLPAMIIYRGANWLWRHIPDLWGFGPGSG